MTIEVTEASGSGSYAWVVMVYIKDANGVDVGNYVDSHEGYNVGSTPCPIFRFTVGADNPGAEVAGHFIDSLSSGGLDFRGGPGPGSDSNTSAYNAVIKSAIITGLQNVDWTDVVSTLYYASTLVAPFTTSDVKIIEGTAGWRDITSES